MENWDPNTPEYGETRQKISEVVNTQDPMNAHHIIASGAEFGVKTGQSTTALRSTFENALLKAQKEQPAGAVR
jgi:hypothetical protein